MNRPPPSASSSYRPEIQGLRAVAVGLVVLYHLWPRRLGGGYVGVDVFFVISGYLITSHIYREVALTGTLKVARFWARRVRRLLPASLLVLALSAVGVLVWAPETVWHASARQLTASALYVQNWALALDAVDYMAMDNVPTVAQHYWSLSVEEQFYLIWPLLILGLLGVQMRLRPRSSPSPEQRRRIMLVGLTALAVASLTWSVISTSQSQSFAYMSTLTRVWEFAAGSITGLLTVRLGRRSATAAGWLGLAAVVFAGVTYTERSAFPGWIALVPVLGTVAVLLAGRGSRGTAGWWLSTRPARFVGDISYSVYLVHWPLIVLVPYATGHLLRWPEKLAILAATVVLAWLSTTFVENPLRVHPALAATTWRSFAFATAGMLVFVAAHAGITHELDRREAAATAAAADKVAQGGRCVGPAALDPAQKCDSVAGAGPLVAPPQVVSQQGRGEIYERCQQSLGASALKSCELGQLTGAKRTVLLLGDSHAAAFTPLLDELGKRMGWRVIAATKGSCPVTTARRVLANETGDGRARSCEAFNKAAADAFLSDPEITDVFVTSFSSAYEWANAPGSTLRRPATDGFTAAWKQWTDAGKRVHVVRDVPGAGKRSVPACIAQAADTGETCDTPRAVALLDDVAALAAKSLGGAVTLHDLTAQFCDARTCYTRIGDVIVYRDTSHLSDEYSRMLAPYLARQLTDLPKVG